MVKSILSRSLILTWLLACSAVALSFSFENNDCYTTNYFSNVINQYSASGTYLSSMSVSASEADSLKGLTFGPDGLLYTTGVKGSGFVVAALDQAGTVHQTYTGSEYVQGNLSFGKIAFANDGQFFVAGQDDLRAFTPGSSASSVIYTNNQIFDVKGLPNGNLLVLSAYSLQEITVTGQVVRSIAPSGISLVDARGVEYDPSNNKIYVSMLGYTGEYFRILKLNGTTAAVEANVSFNYADDLFLTSDSRLLVGSRTQAPGIFDLNLNQIGTLGSSQQMFVTQSVPEPAPAILFGLTLLLARRRKHGLPTGRR